MTSSIDALAIRKALGAGFWGPPSPFGPDGWAFRRIRGGAGSVIVTEFVLDGTAWWHASIAFETDRPSYNALAALHTAVWGGDGYAYQVFAPKSKHINIHENALHLWGRADGKPELPEFAAILGDGRSI